MFHTVLCTENLNIFDKMSLDVETDIKILKKSRSLLSVSEWVFQLTQYVKGPYIPKSQKKAQHGK